MKPSKTLLRAAELLHEARPRGYTGMCDVLNEALDEHWPTHAPLLIKTLQLFKPDPTLSDWCYWGERWSRSRRKVHECRVLALLFMSAMMAAKGK